MSDFQAFLVKWLKIVQFIVAVLQLREIFVSNDTKDRQNYMQLFEKSFRILSTTQNYVQLFKNHSKTISVIKNHRCIHKTV
jgi:hypothetical protein